MKILMVNKFFYIKGGSETYYFNLKKLLEKNGHEVIDFSMKDKKNFESKYSSYFVENIDYNKKYSLFSKIKIAKNFISSSEASKKIEKLILLTKPDVAHLHIFQHQISPSILRVLRKYNIPVIYTAHDLKMLCPNYRMFTQGVICEKCKIHKYIECTRNSCIKNSKLKSFLASVEAYYHYYIKSYNIIDKIITPSKFFYNKLIEWGVEEERITYVSNFLSNDKICIDKGNEKYFLYFGRLSDEKGINTLILAMQDISIPLKIVGIGPLYDELVEYTKSKKNIELLGFKTGNELTNIVGNAYAVILPSEWYENGPYSAIEALRLGRPLIGSDLGGIPELICEGENGFIFSAKNVKEVHECLLKFELMEADLYTKFCENSKNMFLQKYVENVHYEKIISIYHEVIEKNKIVCK